LRNKNVKFFCSKNVDFCGPIPKNVDFLIVWKANEIGGGGALGGGVETIRLKEAYILKMFLRGE